MSEQSPPSGQSIELVPADLADLGLCEDAVRYLLEVGLPVVDDVDPPLGVVFNKPFLYEADGEKYCVFGSENWAPDLYLGIKFGARRVVAVAGLDDQHQIVYINSSIQKFFSTYTAFCPLWVEAEAIDASLNSDHDRLPNDVRIAREKKLYRRIKRLEMLLRIKNWRALRADTWWGRIFEEMGYSLG